MKTNLPPTHPTTIWKTAAAQATLPEDREQEALRLRLAAMAGHLLTDRVAARRAALVDVLVDGRPHTREVLWEGVATRLGESVADCWGKVPREALARDLAVLRQGGLRVGYSRRPGIEGYYLQYPPLERQAPRRYEEINWELIEELRKLSVPERLERAFAAAEFALQQKRLTLAGEHPDWPAARVEREARRIVYGVALRAGE